jgi:hypothetical protein
MLKSISFSIFFFQVQSQMLTYFYNGTDCSMETGRSLKQIIWNNLSTPGGYNLTFACNQVIQTHCQVVDMYPKPPKPFLFYRNQTDLEDSENPPVLDSEEEEETAASNSILLDPPVAEESEELEVPLNYYVSTACFSATEEQKSLNTLFKRYRPDFVNISQSLADETYLRISMYLDSKCTIEYKTSYVIADGSCSRFPDQNSVLIGVHGIHTSIRKFRNDECHGRPFQIEYYEPNESKCTFQKYDKILLSDTYTMAGVYRGKEKYLDFLSKKEQSNAAYPSRRGKGVKHFPWITIIFPILTIILTI